jgi:predicted dehydrogenase
MLPIALLSFAHVRADGYARQVANHPEAEIACGWDDDPLPLPMDQWIAAILHNKLVTITVEDGRNLTQLLEAVYRAAEAGQEVRL